MLLNALLKALVEKQVGTAAGTLTQVLHEFGGVKLRASREAAYL